MLHLSSTDSHFADRKTKGCLLPRVTIGWGKFVEKYTKSTNTEGGVIETKTKWTRKIPRCGSAATGALLP